MTEPFTLLLDGTALEGPARVVDGRAHLVSSRAWDALVGGPPTGEAGLAEMASRLDRVLAVDVDERVAFLGASARSRAARLASLQAPNFTLTDLEGRPHSLAEQRGSKVFLVAWGSW